MAAPRNRPYRHRGVYIPFVAADEGNQWSSDDNIQKKGFIFIDRLHVKGNVLSVQSAATGDIFINKLLEADAARTEDEQAEELRFSTAPDAERRLLGPILVRGAMRTYFGELALWQKIGNGTYSLYLNFYNGGSLDNLWYRYHDELRPIPEHFIWHVFLTLIEAVRWLHTGALPGTDNEIPGWDAIYHRDIATNNVFLHYHHRLDSEAEPVMGFETNAFPEVILGDFGVSNLENDEDRRLRGNCWASNDPPQPWNDTMSIHDVVKELCLTHFPKHYPASDPPTRVNSDDINGTMKAGDTHYSDVLIDTLKLWEYRNFSTSLVDSDQESDGVDVPNSTRIPDNRQLFDTILPLARRMVQRYRRLGNDVPDDWWRQLDISWSKPARVMPYEWMPVKDTGAQTGKKPARRVCPRPNPETNREKLTALEEWERKLPDWRPQHRLVMLEYGQPIVLDLRQVPPPPAPEVPDSPPPPGRGGDSKRRRRE